GKIARQPPRARCRKSGSTKSSPPLGTDPIRRALQPRDGQDSRAPEVTGTPPARAPTERGLFTSAARAIGTGGGGGGGALRRSGTPEACAQPGGLRFRRRSRTIAFRMVEGFRIAATSATCVGPPPATKRDRKT